MTAPGHFVVGHL